MDPDLTVAPLQALLSKTTPTAGNIVLRIVILFALIFINGFFSVSEIAVLSLNDSKIDKMAEDGDKRAKNVQKLNKNTSDFLSAIQIGVTLAGFLSSAVASDAFAPMLANALHPHIKISLDALTTISMILITLVTSYFSLVLGELVPKKIALQKGEKVSFIIAGFLNGFMKILKPFIRLLSHSTNGVCRIIGLDPNADEENVTEDEIRMMVETGEENGVIENTQAEMINNIFEFDDIDAGDVMTHRVDMTAVENTDSISDVINVAISSGKSRIPVYEEDPDNIIGIVYVKDLLKYVGRDTKINDSISSVMREAFFVPETIDCVELFRQMNEKHVQMAVVVDEYGGTAGIVTIEDIMESIVGDIKDEYYKESDEIVKTQDNVFVVDGDTAIDEIDDLTGKKLPDGDYDTVAGFILSELGYLPVNGNKDEVKFENIKFTVLEVNERRIEKVRIEILPEEDKKEAEEKNSVNDKKERESRKESKKKNSDDDE